MRSIAETREDDEVLERIGLIALGLGLVGLIDGTLRAGSHPDWPTPWVWAGMAAIAAVVVLASVFVNDHALRGSALFLSFAVAALRGFGYLVAPRNQINGAAIGAYVMVVGALILVFSLWRRDGADRSPL